MKENKYLYPAIGIAFVAILLISNFFNRDSIIMDCKSITNAKITKKKISKPYLRTIDLLEITYKGRLYIIQSNDQNYVRKIQRDLNSCSNQYNIDYYRKRINQDNIVLYTGKSFF